MQTCLERAKNIQIGQISADCPNPNKTTILVVKSGFLTFSLSRNFGPPNILFVLEHENQSIVKKRCTCLVYPLSEFFQTPRWKNQGNDLQNEYDQDEFNDGSHDSISPSH